MTLCFNPESNLTAKHHHRLIAIHCRQTRGGQYVDLGLIQKLPAGKP